MIPTVRYYIGEHRTLTEILPTSQAIRRRAPISNPMRRVGQAPVVYNEVALSMYVCVFYPLDDLPYPNQLKLDRLIDRPTFFFNILVDWSICLSVLKIGKGSTAYRSPELYLPLQLFYLFMIYMSDYKFRKSCLLAIKLRLQRY